MPYDQCFICRVWSWDACNSFDGATLCLPCYVDVLEMRQDRLERTGGVMGGGNEKDRDAVHGPTELPGNSPPSFRQLDLFDA